jgi:hypothetical protein
VNIDETDTGSGAEDQSIAATSTEAETGAGADAMFTSLTQAETGGDVEVSAFAVSFTVADTASSSDGGMRRQPEFTSLAECVAMPGSTATEPVCIEGAI